MQMMERFKKDPDIAVKWVLSTATALNKFDYQFFAEEHSLLESN
jgi:hypothetical protein